MSEMPTPTEDSQAHHEAEASLSQLTLSQQPSFSQQPVQSSYTQQPPQSYTEQPFVMGTNARATATISAGQTTGVVDPKENSGRRNSLIPVPEIAKVGLSIKLVEGVGYHFLHAGYSNEGADFRRSVQKY